MSRGVSRGRLGAKRTSRSDGSRVEAAVTRRPPPQTRTSGIPASGSSVTRGLRGPSRHSPLALGQPKATLITLGAQLGYPSPSAVFPVTRFVGSMSLSCFLTAERCARLSLPYSGSLGPQFPTYWWRYYAQLGLPIALPEFLRLSLVTQYLVPPLLFVSRLHGSPGRLEFSCPLPGLLFSSVPLIF